MNCMAESSAQSKALSSALSATLSSVRWATTTSNSSRSTPDRRTVTPDKARKVEGDLLRFSYKADNGAFAVAVVHTTEEIIAVGPIAHVTPGQRVVLFGEWKDHINFGKQFQVERVLVDSPRTTRGMMAYLSSGDIKGLGPTYAQRVVEHFGLDTLEILDKQPERLLEVRGIGRNRLKQIMLHLKRETEHRDILSTLRAWELATISAVRLLRKYREDTLAVIHQNPYRLAREVRGIGFKRADTIALSLGIDPESPLRIEATVLHLLKEAESQGHCHLPYSEICTRSQKLSVRLPLVESMLEDMLEDARLYCTNREHKDPPLSRPALGRVERRVAIRLLDLQGAQPDRTLQNLIPIDLPRIEKELGIELNQAQRSAVLSVFQQQVTVITGGPGTGKQQLSER